MSKQEKLLWTILLTGTVTLLLLISIAFSSPAHAWHREGVRIPDLFSENPYFATSAGGITLVNIGTLEVYSGAAGDTTQTAWIYGEDSSGQTQESIALNGTTHVWGATSFEAIYGIKLDGACVGIAKVYDELGEVVAAIPIGDLYCYNAGFLGSTASNFPSGMVVTTTGWNSYGTWAHDYRSDPFLLSDQYPAINNKCSNVTYPITAIYQISDDATNWINGAVALTNLDDNQVRKVTTEPYIRYLRLVLTQSTNTCEAKPSVNIIVTNK